mmetsp:Transcript_6381/g.20079  ORF Transcript_6381/g.20079 Transcript_6381/m.20079 type:complete len:284 (-) Transcript_6381:2958-3809(-)
MAGKAGDEAPSRSGNLVTTRVTSDPLPLAVSTYCWLKHVPSLRSGAASAASSRSSAASSSVVSDKLALAAGAGSRSNGEAGLGIGGDFAPIPARSECSSASRFRLRDPGSGTKGPGGKSAIVAKATRAWSIGRLASAAAGVTTVERRRYLRLGETKSAASPSSMSSSAGSSSITGCAGDAASTISFGAAAPDDRPGDREPRKRTDSGEAPFTGDVSTASPAYSFKKGSDTATPVARCEGSICAAHEVMTRLAVLTPSPKMSKQRRLVPSTVPTKLPACIPPAI